MPTMYDRLGDLLNETLEAGTVKFIRIDRDGAVSEAKDIPGTIDEPAAGAARPAARGKQRTVYKKITPEIERCYRLLGITVSATLEDIKKAYKEKLKYYHPDRHADNPVLLKVATDKTRQVVEAYKMLVA